MELIKIEDLKKEKIIATIGEFDGIHVGHIELINETIRLSKENDCKSCVITFYPHPDYVLNKRKFEGYITSENEKKEILKEMNIDYLLIIDFSINVASLKEEEFYNLYLKDLFGLVIGYDFRFGYMGKGNASYLKDKFNNKVFSVIDKVEFINENNQYTKVGSNEIRDYLKKGNLEIANKLLSRPYMVEGTVINGDHIGREIGFPTANILLDKDTFLSKNGVYSCKCVIDNKEYLGIGNIGVNPTLNYLDNPRLEVNILDFNKSIYEKNIKIYFLKYLRDEFKFNSKEELVNQLIKDKEITKKLYGGIINDK